MDFTSLTSFKRTITNIDYSDFLKVFRSNSITYYLLSTGWAKKSKPDNFCNNFVYCQPIFIIFGSYTL